MAGVSLSIQRLLGSRSFLAQAAGYVYAGLAMAGPWFLTSLHMYLLGVMDIPGVTPEILQSYQAVVLYGYCGSMLLTGVLQLVSARYLSDRLFVKDTQAVVPAYTSTAILSLLAHAALAVGAAALLRPPPGVALAGIAFFGCVGLVWSGMIFLGTLRCFSLILASFGGGIALALALSWPLAPRLGLAGLLTAFGAGHALVAAVFLSRLRAEFPAKVPWDFGLLVTAVKHPLLTMVGVAFSTGVWIDKIIYWWGPWSLRSAAGLRIFPMYDNAIFLAYFTVIPSMVLIFIRLEGSFHDKYARFYRSIRDGADLRTIRENRADIVRSFRMTLLRIAVLQGAVTMLVLFLAPWVVAQFRLEWISFYVFRLACVGAYLQMLVLAVLLSAIHLALYRIALVVSLVYAAAAGLGAWATLRCGLEYLGAGTVAAGGLALVIGYICLRSELGVLERRTFMHPSEG